MWFYCGRYPLWRLDDDNEVLAFSKWFRANHVKGFRVVHRLNFSPVPSYHLANRTTLSLAVYYVQKTDPSAPDEADTEVATINSSFSRYPRQREASLLKSTRCCG